MNFEIKFIPEAVETYNAVVGQLRQRWGNKFVSKFEKKVSITLDRLTSSPDLYPLIDERTEVRKCVIHKNCSMFYKKFDDYVLIISFWDNRQEPL